MAEPFTFQVVTDLVTDLVAAGLSASVNPAELNLPAVLVQPQAIDSMLSGFQIRVRLAVIAKDTDPARAMGSLAETLSTVLEVVDPDDQVTTATMILPDGTAYPALLVPVDLWTQEFEPPE